MFLVAFYFFLFIAFLKNYLCGGHGHERGGPQPKEGGGGGH